MEEMAYALHRSETSGGGRDDYFQLVEDIREPMMATTPSEVRSSFTALLELPANKAIELLHSPVIEASSGEHRNPYDNIYGGSPIFSSDAAFVERTAAFIHSNHSASFQKPKCEPTDADSYPDSSSPLISDPPRYLLNSTKRKEREKMVNKSTKKGKKAANGSSIADPDRFPCVHVRARRGQATDSHSLAERARRDKINARMKLLQELVPGCNKITGTALVLDEIINHVQSLQQQVELLSMKLAAVSPRIDSNFDCLMAAGMGASQMESGLHGMVMPLMWQGLHVNNPPQQHQCEQQQQWQMDALHQPIWETGDDTHNLLTPHNQLLS